MTPEQELAYKQAEAQAEAEAAAEAENNAAAGVTNESTGQTASGFGGMVKEAVRGAGEGLANIVDTPWTVGQALQHSGAESQFSTGETPPAIVEPPSTGHLRDQASPVADVYNYELPPDPEHPWVRNVARVAGPAIVEAASGGGASSAVLPSLLRVPVRAAATTGGTMIGGEVGRQADLAAGGDGTRGQSLGSIIFGGVVPSVTNQGAWKFGSHLLTDDESAARLAAAKIANVPPSVGLVGNKFAAGLEDATVAQPFAGGPAYNARRAQYEALDAAARDIAAQTRGGPSTGDIDKSTMGQQVRETAAIADKNAVAAQNARMNPLYEQAGRDLPIDQTTQLDQMDTIRRGSQPQYRAPVQTEIDNVNASRFDPENAPKVVDPGLEAQLQMRLSQAQRRLQGARTSGDAQAAQSDIDSVSQELDRNRGQTLQEAVESRSFTGKKIDGQVPLTARQTIATKQAQTQAIKNATTLAGVPPEEFDAANRDYGLIAGQRRKLIQPLTEEKTAGQGEAYNKLFTGTARSNTDRIAALNRFAPGPLQQVMADELETRLRGAGAGNPPNPETIGPTVKTAPDWWENTPEPTRAIMRPDGPQLAALLETMRADARRPSRTVPGAGGNTLGLGSIFGNVGTGGATALSALAGGPIAGAVTAAGIPLAAWGTGKAFTNPNFVNRIVGARREGLLDNVSLARILSGAAGNPSSQ